MKRGSYFASNSSLKQTRKPVLLIYCIKEKKTTKNRLVKSCTLEPGGLFTTKDFEEGVQSLDTAITDMSGCSLNYWLSKFVQEVSNSSGERYPSRSLLLLSNKYSLILCKLSLSYFSGIYHFHWRVVYCFSLGIQTHARDVVYMQE